MAKSRIVSGCVKVKAFRQSESLPDPSNCTKRLEITQNVGQEFNLVHALCPGPVGLQGLSFRFRVLGSRV